MKKQLFVISSLFALMALILATSRRISTIELSVGDGKINPCYPTFNNASSFKGIPLSAGVKTIWFSELHGINHEQMFACLAWLVRAGDHVLLEVPDTGKAVACDTLYPIYKELNDNVTCYGFDTAFSNANRIKFIDAGFLANFISERYEGFLRSGKNSGEIIKNIVSFADFLSASPSHESDLEFNKRAGHAIKQFALAMKGMSIAEMRAYMFKRNNELAEMAKQYQTLSRDTETNTLLVKKIKHHQGLLSDSPHRLFVVAGADHLNITKNADLSELFNENHAIMKIFSK